MFVFVEYGFVFIDEMVFFFIFWVFIFVEWEFVNIIFCVKMWVFLVVIILKVFLVNEWKRYGFMFFLMGFSFVLDF